MRAYREVLLMASRLAIATTALSCDDGAPAPIPMDGGSILQINGLIDHCPMIESIGISPSVVTVGKPSMVSATASDQDAGDVLSFAWSTGNGSFSAPTAASSSYTCSTPGTPTVTLEVSDGRCLSRSAIAVVCVPGG
jgi:hypothetical protein